VRVVVALSDREYPAGPVTVTLPVTPVGVTTVTPRLPVVGALVLGALAELHPAAANIAAPNTAIRAGLRVRWIGLRALRFIWESMRV
jgi:hypothetical protein